MDIYVNTQASGDGDGSEHRPFKTLAAANRIAKSGDTVRVLGTFRETLKLATPGVVWKGEGATLDGGYTRAGDPPSAGLPGKEYGKMVELAAEGVIFDGFSIRNVAGQPVGITADNAKLLNCTLDFAYGGGIVAEDVKNPLIENCRILRCDQKRYDASNTGGGPANVQVNLLFKNIKGGVIRGCEVAYSHGEGIAMAMGSQNNLIEGNTVHDCLHMHLLVNGSQNNIFRNNFVYHAADPEFCQRSSGNPPAGILIADEHQRAEEHDLKPSSGNQFIGNIVVGMSQNFVARKSKNSNGDLIDTVIANNTFVNAFVHEGEAINIKIPQADHKGSVFENNIIIQDVGEIARINGGNGVILRHNAWSRKPTEAASGEGDQLGDVCLFNANAPLDVSASRDNYELTERSTLAIGKGTGGKDIGAIAYVQPEPTPEPEPEPIDDWRVHYAEFGMAISAAVNAVMKMAAAWEAEEGTR